MNMLSEVFSVLLVLPRELLLDVFGHFVLSLFLLLAFDSGLAFSLAHPFVLYVAMFILFLLLLLAIFAFFI